MQGEPFNKEPHKHSELTWFAVDDLPKKMLHAHCGALELIKKILHTQSSLVSNLKKGTLV